MSVDVELFFESVEGFEWDRGNLAKNKFSHRVDARECEEVFFNRPLFISDDEKHSKNEKRFYALGKSNSERNLFVAFTTKKSLIRVISARDMSRKERLCYNEGETQKKNS